MTDSERLIMISKYAGVSLNKLAKEIGITTPQTFYDIKAGKHGISKDLAEKIQARYLNISMAWLLTGEGEMLLSESEVVEIEADDSDKTSTSIPVVSDEVLSKRGVDIKKYIESNGAELRYIDPSTLFSGAELMIEMVKDCMAPDIMPGDKVILQFLPDGAKLQSGGMYFINSLTYADVVRDVFLDGDKAILKARNRRYGDIVLNINTGEIVRMANVLGIYRNTFSTSYAQLDELRTKKDEQIDRFIDSNNMLIEEIRRQNERQDKLVDKLMCK